MRYAMHVEWFGAKEFDEELVKKILEAFKRVDEYIPVEPDDK